MTCQGCADSIQSAISSKSFAISAHVNLKSAQLTLESNSVIDLKELNSAISDLGTYKILNNKPILPLSLMQYFIEKKTHPNSTDSSCIVFPFNPTFK